MKQQLTFKEYRNLDLLMFAIMVIIFEAIATVASGWWAAFQAVNISVSLLLVCIVMMRWNGYAAIHAVIGGFVYCFAINAIRTETNSESVDIKIYVIYCIGNVFALVALILFEIWDKEKIRSSIVKSILFVTTAYFGMAVGKCAVSLFFGGDFGALLTYITTDIMSLLFAVIVFILLRKSDGMTEDQKTYLIRLEKERKEETSVYEENDGII